MKKKKSSNRAAKDNKVVHIHKHKFQRMEYILIGVAIAVSLATFLIFFVGKSVPSVGQAFFGERYSTGSEGFTNYGSGYGAGYSAGIAGESSGFTEGLSDVATEGVWSQMSASDKDEVKKRLEEAKKEAEERRKRLTKELEDAKDRRDIADKVGDDPYAEFWSDVANYIFDEINKLDEMIDKIEDLLNGILPGDSSKSIWDMLQEKIGWIDQMTLKVRMVNSRTGAIYWLFDYQVIDPRNPVGEGKGWCPAKTKPLAYDLEEKRPVCIPI